MLFDSSVYSNILVSQEHLEAAQEVASQAREAIRRACDGGVIHHNSIIV